MRRIKNRMLVATLVGGFLCTGVTDATTFNFNSAFPNSGVIPDGDTTGWYDTRTISGTGGTITDVNVFLNLSGGYNGDLYGYLVHDGGFAILLNRPGVTGSSAFGYSDSGMNLKFDDSAANGDIHFYQLVGGYSTSLIDGSSWKPDGRGVDPETVNGTETRDSLLNDFVGLSGDGEWTLFLADLSVGEQSTVLSWGLEITAVPEPSGWVILGLGLVGMMGVMRYRSRTN